MQLTANNGAAVTAPTAQYTSTDAAAGTFAMPDGGGEKRGESSFQTRKNVFGPASWPSSLFTRGL